MLKKIVISTLISIPSYLGAGECESLTRSGDEIIFYGDTHGFHTNKILGEHLKGEYSKKDLALFVHLGDIKNYAEPDLNHFFSVYNFLLDDQEMYSTQDKNLFVLGNHDFTDSQRILEQLRSKFTNSRASFAENELIRIVNEQQQTRAWLITLNTKHLDENKSYIYDESELENQISRFTSCIEADSNKAAPLFIVSHEGYHDTHSLPRDIQKWFYYRLPEMLLNQYPDRPVLAFNGHKHHYVRPRRFSNVSFINAPRAGAEKHKGGKYGYISCKIENKRCVLKELSSSKIYESEFFNF